MARGDVAVLAYRFDREAGLELEHMESWVASARGGKLEALLTLPGWVTGVWMSPQRAIWATHTDGRVLWRGADGGEWHPTTFPGSLGGIWGVDDANVFVWGSERGQHFVSRWDGAKFESSPMRAQVLAMHGAHPELVFAVGADGLVSRWDGAGWSELEVPTRRAFWSVHVQSEERVFACGPAAMLMGGSADELLPLPDPAFAPKSVLVHGGAIWLGCGELGLHGYEDGVTVPRHFDVCADALVPTGDGVVVQSPLRILGSDELVRFVEIPLADFVELAVDRPPTFAPYEDEPAEQDDDEDDGFELPDPPDIDFDDDATE